MNTSDAFANTYQSTELNKCVPSSLLPSIVVGEHYLKERGTLNEGLSCLRNYYRWFGPPSPHLLHSWQKMPGKALDWNMCQWRNYYYYHHYILSWYRNE